MGYSNIMKSKCFMSEVLLWFLKCTVPIFFSGKKDLHNIYHLNTNILNYIVSCHTYFSSGKEKSSTARYLSKQVADIGVFQDI